jgi:hypothetical protein
MTGERRPAPVALRRLAVAVAVAGALAIGSFPVGIDPAGSATTRQEGAAEVTLVDQTTWHTRDDTFETRVRVTGAPPGATTRLTVHDRLVSRAAFQDSLTGDLGRTLHEGESQPLDGPDGPAGREVGFSLPVGAGGAGLSDHGLYPVQVVVAAADGTTLATLITHLALIPSSPDTYPALDVAVVFDVSSDPMLQPDGSVEVDAAALDRAAERAAVLAEAPGVDATLASRPETLDGLARVSRGAEVVESLARARSPVVARPFTDIDLAALEAADLLGEANHHAEMGADVIRERFGTEPTGGIWLADGTIGPDASRLLVDLGIDRAVVPPDAVADLAGAAPVPETPVRLGADGPTTLVTDPVVADRLTAGGTLGAQQAVSELAMIWFETPAIPREVVVRVPADRPLDVDAVGRVLRELDAGHAIDVAPLDELFAVPPRDGELPVVTPAPHEAPSLNGIARQVEEARDEIAGYGDALDDPEAGHDAEASLLLATGATTPDGRRSAYMFGVVGRLGALADAVNAPEQFRITLTSRSSTIPLSITNDTTSPVAVRIELDSTRLEFPEGDVITTTLEPGTTRLEVPVETRTSGAFPLEITITSPDGSIELDRTTFDIRSTAVSGVGLVLSVGTVLFLLVWWARNWRSTRRSRQLVPADDRSDSGPDGGDPDGAPGMAGPEAVATGPDQTARPEPAGAHTDDGVEGTARHRARHGTGAHAERGRGPESPDDDDGYRPAHMARTRPRGR